MADPLPAPTRPHADPYQVRAAASLLRRPGPALLVLAGQALCADALARANRIAAATGAKLIAMGCNARVPLNRIPSPRDQAVRALSEFRTVILVGCRKPVIFFAHPGKPGSPVPPEAELHILARPEQDPAGASARLAEELRAGPAAIADPGPGPAPARGPLTPDTVAQTLAALLPEEAITYGRAFFPATYSAAPHEWPQVTGGAIGGGPPIATGAAIGAPARQVINLQADGSAMDRVQALWTQARERLPVTTVLFSNRKYAILPGELANVGANPGRTALAVLDLGNPDLDRVGLARAMGVEAARAATCEAFADLFSHALTRPAPFLIGLLVEIGLFLGRESCPMEDLA